MNYISEVKQEDTSDTYSVSPFAEGETVANLSDAGWVCRQIVMTPDGLHRVIEKVVTAKTTDDMYFSATLEPDDTAQLNEQQYIWIIEVENLLTTPKFRRELEITLAVEKHGVFNPSETQTIHTLLTTSADGLSIDIDSNSVPVGVRSIKLLNDDGDILQTVGYVSHTIVLGVATIVLKQPVTVTATQVQVNS